MIRRPSFKEFREEAFKDEEFKEKYEALDSEFELLEKFIKATRRTLKISLQAKKR